MYFHVRKSSNNGFNLYVNNTMFKAGSVARNDLTTMTQSEVHI